MYHLQLRNKDYRYIYRYIYIYIYLTKGDTYFLYIGIISFPKNALKNNHFKVMSMNFDIYMRQFLGMESFLELSEFFHHNIALPVYTTKLSD